MVCCTSALFYICTGTGDTGAHLNSVFATVYSSYHLSSHCTSAWLPFPISAPILFLFFFLANGLVDQSIPRISNRCTSATPVAPNNFINSNIPSICTKTLIQCISHEIQCCKNTQTSSSCCSQKIMFHSKFTKYRYPHFSIYPLPHSLPNLQLLHWRVSSLNKDKTLELILHPRPPSMNCI